jgi:hypothetical protein
MRPIEYHRRDRPGPLYLYAHRVPIIRTAVGAAVLAMLAVTGCSSAASTVPGGITVAALISDMKAGFATANSLRISGGGTFSGQHVVMNVGLIRSGDESGTIVVGTLPVTLVSVGGVDYVYVSKAFFNYLHATRGVPNSSCARICGKYIKLANSPFSSKFNFGLMTRQIKNKLPVPTSVPHVKVTTYHGQSAYELYDNQGRKVFIAKDGVHYLLGMVLPGKFALNFSQWNAVPPVTAPPPSKVISG